MHDNPDHRLCSDPDCVDKQKRHADVAEAQRIALEALLLAVDRFGDRYPRVGHDEVTFDELMASGGRVIEAREAYRLAMGAGEI